ncbi:tRNA dihydrouridine synthase DusB [Methylovirgula sp. 4M-Z18]|uniref:tRNA dihydrouridine synthase DusB n=1 Tax=Methylovirgula sp. 4M-Z18 TaxID=2293567 RepID=UPI0032AED276
MPPLTIGPVTLSGRAILAPMSGVTDVGMRRLAMRFGASLVVSEMVASDDYVRGEEESRIRAEGAGVAPHVVQIAGRDPHWMAEAAKLAEHSGAAIVDINMGCPAKKVTGGYAGSALMRDLDHALALIEATVAAVKIPVTLKMRLGWDDRWRNAPELARRAEVAGVQLITVHGRTRCQFYKGGADWAAIRAVRDAMRVPLVANGDCETADDAANMLRLSGADAVMVGRAAVGQPWLVGDIAHALRTGRQRAQLSAAARFGAAVEHYDTLLDLFGEAQGLRHARKHLVGYAEKSRAADHAEFTALRGELVTSQSPAHVRRLLRQLGDMDDAAPLREAA